jgi:hypothetical protein
MKSDPHMPMRKDLDFCLGYLKLPLTFRVGATYYLALYRNNRVLSETDFQDDLESTLYVALRPYEEKA